MAKTFSSIFPDFEFNLLTHSPWKFEVDRINASAPTFGFVETTTLKNRLKSDFRR